MAGPEVEIFKFAAEKLSSNFRFLKPARRESTVPARSRHRVVLRQGQQTKLDRPLPCQVSGCILYCETPATLGARIRPPSQPNLNILAASFSGDEQEAIPIADLDCLSPK